MPPDRCPVPRSRYPRMALSPCVGRRRNPCRSWLPAPAGLTQLFRALIAADFDDVCSDFHLDGRRIEFAIAGGAGFLIHDPISLGPADRARSGDHFGPALAVGIFSGLRARPWIA